MDDVEAAPAATPVQVKFTGITLDVKTGKDQTKRILDDVSGHFGPAESVAVMGPSGSGKTTLLLCVSGAAAPETQRRSVVLPEPLGPMTATLSAGPKWPLTSSKMRFVWSLPVFTSRVMPVNLTCTGVAAGAASTSSMVIGSFSGLPVYRGDGGSIQAHKSQIGCGCVLLRNPRPMAVTNCV